MSSASFTISFDDDTGQEPTESAREPMAGTGMGKENKQTDNGGDVNDVLAWEVEFTSGGDAGAQKTKKMPKFLREREKARQARLEQLKQESEVSRAQSAPQTSSRRAARPTNSPQGGRSKIPSPRKPWEENKQRVAPPRPASVASFSTERVKRSPALIKQPLLPVKSSKQPERKALSATNSPLGGRRRAVKQVVRPSSAKTSREMTRQRRGEQTATEVGSPLGENRKQMVEELPLKTKVFVTRGDDAMYANTYMCTLSAYTPQCVSSTVTRCIQR